MPKDCGSSIQEVVQQLASELGNQPLSFETTDGQEMVLLSRARYEQLVRCEQEMLSGEEGEESLEESPLLIELNNM